MNRVLPRALPLACLLLSGVALGCEPARPRYHPYVPAEGFEEALQISSELPDSVAAAGQWVTMHAERRAGPWEPKAVSSRTDHPCERIAPALREYEVASKVRWHIQPSEGVVFNTPGPPDFQRQIRFTRPGRYVLHAVSEGCAGPFASNRLTVVVR